MTQVPTSRFYGRRQGRPLRTRKTALMEELLPSLQITLPHAGKLDPQSLFPTPRAAFWLEIGFGGGEHLAAQAQAHPHHGFLGCEPFRNGVASLLDHIDLEKLTNIRIFPDDARHLLDALPVASLARCFVLFPDPWPKKRHAVRRFIGPENLARLARALEPGGELRLATDVVDLASWMREHAQADPHFTMIHDSALPPEGWVATRYEQKGRAAGRLPHYLCFRRKNGGVDVKG